jgi:hypothetical protein
MPEKWKPDETKVDRQTKKVTKIKHYLHHTPTQELKDYLEKSYTRPKLIQKALKELKRRSERTRSR